MTAEQEHDTFQGAADPAQMAPAAEDPDTVTMHVVPERVRYHRTFGDMLAATMPGFDILPCGRCGTAFAGAPPDVLSGVRVLQSLVELARDAGWAADQYGVWCCCSCLDAAEVIPDPGDDGTEEWLHQHQRILHECDLRARSTMTASGRHDWDYDAWRYRWPARAEECVPEAAAEQRVTA